MVETRKGDSKDRPVASPDDVRRLAGPVDDETVAEILKIGASYGELEIAAAYAQGEGSLVERAGHTLTGKIADLYELLSAERDDEDAVH